MRPGAKMDRSRSPGRQYRVSPTISGYSLRRAESRSPRGSSIPSREDSSAWPLAATPERCAPASPCRPRRAHPAPMPAGAHSPMWAARVRGRSHSSSTRPASAPGRSPPGRRSSLATGSLCHGANGRGGERAVPLAMHTGWNPRAPAIGSPEELFSMTGSYFAFPAETMRKLLWRQRRLSREGPAGGAAAGVVAIPDRARCRGDREGFGEGMGFRDGEVRRAGRARVRHVPCAECNHAVPQPRASFHPHRGAEGQSLRSCSEAHDSGPLRLFRNSRDTGSPM